MPKFEVTQFDMTKSVEETRDQNIRYAKKFISEGNSFAPTVFVMTKKCLYYISLDTEIADETRTSPMDQVAPVVKQFLDHQKELGEMLAYQVIGEAWMKRFTMPEDKKLPPVGHGDIAKMADRIEVLMESCIRKGKIASFKTFEIMREESSEKVMDFKKMKFDGSLKSPKFPIIPKASDTWTGDLANE